LSVITKEGGRRIWSHVGHEGILIGGEEHWRSPIPHVASQEAWRISYITPWALGRSNTSC